MSFQQEKEWIKNANSDENIEGCSFSPMLTTTRILNYTSSPNLNEYYSPCITRNNDNGFGVQKEKSKMFRVRSRSLGDTKDLIFYGNYNGYNDDYGNNEKTVLIHNIKKEENKTSITPNKNTMSEPKSNFSIYILYGLINATIVLPVIMSFGSIIYHDPFFRPYLPVLVKLTVFSGMVHQVCFSSISSLPFAVGQVQDAGLIFLSAMATSIVKYCKERNYDDEQILATVTIGLSLFTSILGISIVIIGKFKLASYVQMLPTSVVGGYLAFIGFFCGQAGLTLMSGISESTSDEDGTDDEVNGFWDWYKFFSTREQIQLVSPGLIGGIGVFILLRNVRHMAVLPSFIALMIIVFYVTLYILDISVDEARSNGWINKADDPPVWYHTWHYLQFDKVIWSALPSQTLTLMSMIFVVGLSSSLDVAAIELDYGSELNYDHELITVGVSNIISGFTGGYTGSYIFSQTIFTMRAGITSRTSGYMLALFELISIILPFSILAYVPNFFFGSLLIMICVDLMYEWLWDVREKVTPASYAVVLCTFVLIQINGVEYGILAGLLLYLLAKKSGFNMGDTQEYNTEDEDEDEESEKYVMGRKMNSIGGSIVNFFTMIGSVSDLRAHYDNDEGYCESDMQESSDNNMNVQYYQGAMSERSIDETLIV